MHLYALDLFFKLFLISANYAIKPHAFPRSDSKVFTLGCV